MIKKITTIVQEIKNERLFLTGMFCIYTAIVIFVLMASGGEDTKKGGTMMERNMKRAAERAASQQ